MPLVEIDATPSVPSNCGKSISSTKLESSTVEYPSRVTADTLTGSILGFILRMYGWPTLSFQLPPS